MKHTTSNIICALLVTAMLAIFNVTAEETPAPEQKPAPPSAQMQQRPPKKGRYNPPPPHFRRSFEHLRTTNPKEFQRLMRLHRTDRKKFREEIAKYAPKPANDFHRKLREVDKKCWTIAAQLRQSPPPPNAEQLRKELDEQIALSTQLIIQNTKERLEKLQKHLQHIQENQNTIQEERRNFFLNNPPPPPQK